MLNPSAPPLPQMLVILGPTASGKTHLAVAAARRLIRAGHPAEIISADSRQVYQDMNIGTGKDLAEYTHGGEPVPYHLIDIVAAGTDYNVFRYQQDFDRAMQTVLGRGAVPIVCGGSGLYLEAALRPTAMLPMPPNEDFRLHLNTLTDSDLQTLLIDLPRLSPPPDTTTRRRLIRAVEIGTYLAQNPDARPPLRPALPPYHTIGLDPPVPVRRNRISQRLRQRLENGLITEVEYLLAGGISPEKLIFYGLEYRYVTQYLLGTLTLTEMSRQLETAIHQFAKRQMTFFRKMEHDGLAIAWQPTPTLPAFSALPGQG